MVADANIFAQYLRPARSVFDYEADLDARDAGRLKLQAMQQEMQQAQAVRAQEAATRNAFQGLLRQSGGDQNKLYQALMSSGDPALYAQGQALQKQMLEARGKESEIAGRDATAAKTGEETIALRMKQYREALPSVQNPAQAAQWRMAQFSDPVLGPFMQKTFGSPMQAGEIPQDPQAFAEWREREGLGMDRFVAMQTQRRGQDMTAQTARETAAMTDARVRAEGAANRAVQVRGQNMTDARSREMASITKTDAQARKEAEKLEGGVQKYAATLQKEGIPELETAVAAAEGALGRYAPGEVPGVGRISGAVPSALLSNEGNDVRQAVAAVRNIVLNARSGAAVTDQELRRMVEELGTGLGQSEDALRRGLQKVRARLEMVKANAAAGVTDDVKGLYEERGGVRIQRGGQKPAQPAQAPSAPAAPTGFRILKVE